jgi:putative phosphoesterase
MHEHVRLCEIRAAHFWLGMSLTIGLISDTHGLLRPQAKLALAGVDRIIHAGDIGTRAVLEELRALAPVDAVRGNNDRGSAWARSTPATLRIELARSRVFVLHDVKELDFDPAQEGIDVVIAGHSHRPVIATRGGVLYVNPGSAGPRRFNLPVTIGFLKLGETRARAPILELL